MQQLYKGCKDTQEAQQMHIKNMKVIRNCISLVISKLG